MKKIIVVLAALLLAPAAFCAVPAAAEDAKLAESAQAKAKAGNFEQAIILFEKAIYANPMNGAAFEGSGRVYLELGDKETAADYIGRAYEITGKQELKILANDLMESTYGFRSLSFYPFSFAVHGGFGVSVHGGEGSIFPFSFIVYGEGDVLYHITDSFALKAGVIYAPVNGSYYLHAGYLDFPLAAVLKLGSGRGGRQLLSGGVYFGAKIYGSLTDYTDPGYDESKIAATDFGLHLSYQLCGISGKAGLIYGFTLNKSFAEIYPGLAKQPMSILATVGVAF